jgi:hypothetical protein
LDIASCPKSAKAQKQKSGVKAASVLTRAADNGSVRHLATQRPFDRSHTHPATFAEKPREGGFSIQNLTILEQVV